MGILAALLANVNRDPKQKAEPYSPSDFMPDFSPKPEKDAADLLATVVSVNAMLGGRDKRAGILEGATPPPED